MSSVAIQRASHKQWVLKPQDLAVALKLVALNGEWLPYAELGDALHLSRYEAHAAVQRLLQAKLLVEIAGPPQPMIENLRQFVIHGASFAYPPVRIEMTIGIPTAHGVSPIKESMHSSKESIPVWPHSKSKKRGPGLLPLYEKLPLAALEDKAFYELLALFDALRIGQARERQLAKQFLKERLS